MPTPAIKTIGLCKEFHIPQENRTSDKRDAPSSLKALDNVSFEIQPGCVCGLIGPNGAGKTTLLRIISSVIMHDSGKVEIFGQKASKDITRRLLGYMPEERGLYQDMRVGEQIAYFAKLHGADKHSLNDTIDNYLRLFNLEEEKNRKVGSLSKGNQQKVQIIATLAHNPDIVILDEPFSGFDPINTMILTGLLNHLRERGTTLILSSHNMTAVQECCDTILLVDHGHLLLNGSVSEIRLQHADGSIDITTSEKLETSDFSNLTEQLDETFSRIGRFDYRATLKPGVRSADLIAAVAQKVDILKFEKHLPSLTEIFLKFSSNNA